MPYMQDPAVKAMKICIIGAGVGGLTCALVLAKSGFQDIEVFQYVSDLAIVGAGIQMAPNMARIFDRLGVWGDIASKAVVLNSTSTREGATDTEFASLDLKYINKTYGYPNMVGHRVTLAGVIYRGCQQRSAIRFFFGTSVRDAMFGARPTFIAYSKKNNTSRVIEADILLACNGVKSQIRELMLKQLGLSSSVKVQDTNQATYHVMLTLQQMMHDLEVKRLIDGGQIDSMDRSQTPY